MWLLFFVLGDLIASIYPAAWFRLWFDLEFSRPQPDQVTLVTVVVLSDATR